MESGNGEPPLDYEDDLPESSGTWIDRVFWFCTRHLLPKFLEPPEPFPKWLTEWLWIDCAYCFAMRFGVLGFLLGGTCGVIATVVVTLLV